LLLSGVLAPQAEQVAAAYAPFLQLTVYQELDGWVALAGQLSTKPPS
jgi:ribosomal protein L11 methyltransferase